MKFPSNLNCDGKIVSEMGPDTNFGDIQMMVIVNEAFLCAPVN